MPTLTAPQRLDLLLDWLNGAFETHHFEAGNPEPVALDTDHAAIRRTLASFLKSFDGSKDAGHIVALAATPGVLTDDDMAKATPEELTDDDLDALGARLQLVLEQGFGVIGGDAAFPMDSLTFTVRGVGRQKPGKVRTAAAARRVVAGGVVAQRAYHAAGAYLLEVTGPTQTLVPFLVAHLLTQPGMVAVKRCKRPGCPHFIVTATAARGRPKVFCSATCRAWNAEIEEQQRMQKRRKS
jgi:hypothetical protein